MELELAHFLQILCKLKDVLPVALPAAQSGKFPGHYLHIAFRVIAAKTRFLRAVADVPEGQQVLAIAQFNGIKTQ